MASTVMAATIVSPATSTVTLAVASPWVIFTTVPGSWLRALIFMGTPQLRAITLGRGAYAAEEPPCGVVRLGSRVTRIRTLRGGDDPSAPSPGPDHRRGIEMKPSEGWWRRVGVATGALAVAAAGWGLGAGPLAARAAGPTVSIHEGPPSCAVPSYCYAPAQVTANPGDTVTWSNASDAPHTVTRCTPAACAGAGPGTGTDVLSSPQITRGGAFTFAVHSPGTYAYYCTVHGFAVMHG